MAAPDEPLCHYIRDLTFKDYIEKRGSTLEAHDRNRE